MKKKRNKLTDDTIAMYMQKKAYRVYLSSTGYVLFTDRLLAKSFNRDVELVSFDWFKK